MAKRQRSKVRSAKIIDFAKEAGSRADIKLYLAAFSSVRGRMRGTSLTVRGRNDYELWSRMLTGTLAAMGYEDSTIMLGFLADLINQQSPDTRRSMVNAIINGLGLQIVEHDGWFCQGCGQRVMADKWDEEANPFPHHRIGTNKEGQMFIIPLGADGGDIPEELRATVRDCEGRPEPTKLFERFMDPTYEPLIGKEERAKAEAQKSGLWVPGRD